MREYQKLETVDSTTKISSDLSKWWNNAMDSYITSRASGSLTAFKSKLRRAWTYNLPQWLIQVLSTLKTPVHFALGSRRSCRSQLHPTNFANVVQRASFCTLRPKRSLACSTCSIWKCATYAPSSTLGMASCSANLIGAVLSSGLVVCGPSIWYVLQNSLSECHCSEILSRGTCKLFSGTLGSNRK